MTNIWKVHRAIVDRLVAQEDDLCTVCEVICPLRQSTAGGNASLKYVLKGTPCRRCPSVNCMKHCTLHTAHEEVKMLIFPRTFELVMSGVSHAFPWHESTRTPTLTRPSHILIDAQDKIVLRWKYQSLPAACRRCSLGREHL